MSVKNGLGIISRKNFRSPCNTYCNHYLLLQNIITENNISMLLWVLWVRNLGSSASPDTGQGHSCKLSNQELCWGYTSLDVLTHMSSVTLAVCQAPSNSTLQKMPVWSCEHAVFALYHLFFENLTVYSLSHVRDSWDPVDYSLQGSSVCRILQARILEWVAISFSIENLIHDCVYCAYSLSRWIMPC